MTGKILRLLALSAGVQNFRWRDPAHRAATVRGSISFHANLRQFARLESEHESLRFPE